MEKSQEKKNLEIKLPLMCRSKKNHQRIVFNRATKRPMVIQNEIYKQFEKDCAVFLINKVETPINYPVNLKCTFYVKDRIRRDLTNLENAIADILVKYGVLEDDNYNIIAGWDGSRVIYEKGREETIIEISKM